MRILKYFREIEIDRIRMKSKSVEKEQRYID